MTERRARSLEHRRKQLRAAVELLSLEPSLVPPGGWSFWEREAEQLGEGACFAAAAGGLVSIDRVPHPYPRCSSRASIKN